MVLIIGGAYQGKLDYALNNGLGKTISQCVGNNTDIDLSADIINSYHLLILAQIRGGIDPQKYIADKLPEFHAKTIICDDISCGVVPVDATMRAWREGVGRSLALLSKNADEVIRLFCGIGSRIK